MWCVSLYLYTISLLSGCIFLSSDFREYHTIGLMYIYLYTFNSCIKKNVYITFNPHDIFLEQLSLGQNIGKTINTVHHSDKRCTLT
jgi:hypothetical protein